MLSWMIITAYCLLLEKLISVTEAAILIIQAVASIRQRTISIQEVEISSHSKYQKQPHRGFFKKRCSENIQQIYWRTPMPKSYFNKVALQLWTAAPKILSFSRSQ